MKAKEGERWTSNGALRSWSWELVDVSPDVESGSYTTSASLEFTPFTDPNPIQSPDIESEPDPTDFGPAL